MLLVKVSLNQKIISLKQVLGYNPAKSQATKELVINNNRNKQTPQI